MQSSLSIHPRVQGGQAVCDPVDTSKTFKGGGKLAKKQAWLRLRRNDHSASLKGTKHPQRYRIPGSMNQHK